MTVGEMCEKMTLPEFVKWQTFFEKKAMLERGEQDPEEMDENALAKAFGFG